LWIKVQNLPIDMSMKNDIQLLQVIKFCAQFNLSILNPNVIIIYSIPELKNHKAEDFADLISYIELFL
jgi:hypothetical protein